MRFLGDGSFAENWFVGACGGLDFLSSRGMQRRTQVKELDRLIGMLQSYSTILADPCCARLDANQWALVQKRASRKRIARRDAAAQKVADALVSSKYSAVMGIFPSLSKPMALVLATRVDIEALHWGNRQAKRYNPWRRSHYARRSCIFSLDNR